MSHDSEQTKPRFNFGLRSLAGTVVALGIGCALIPGGAFVLVAVTPSVTVFLVFVIGAVNDNEWLLFLGAFLMAIGLGIGCLLFTML